MVSAFLKGSGCLYEGNRPYADGGDLWTHRVLVAVWTAKSTSIVCCLGELPRVTDTLDAITGRNILVITILSRSCYLAIAPIHLPCAPASRGDEEGQGWREVGSSHCPWMERRGTWPPHPSHSALSWGERARRAAFPAKAHASSK